MSAIKRYSKLWKYARKYWPIVGLMLASASILMLLRVIVPFLAGDVVLVLTTTESIHSIEVIAIEIVLISGASGVLQFSLGYGGQYLGQKIIYDMRNELFTSIQGQSFSFHDRNQTGQLMARATGDVEAVRRFLAFGSAQLFGNALLIAFVVVSSYFVGWDYGLILSLVVPLLLYISWRYGQAQAPFWRKAREDYGAINSVLQENITGMKIVRSFTAEDSEISKFREKNAAYRDEVVGASVIRSFYSPLLTLVVSLSLGAIYILGGFQVSAFGLAANVTAAHVVTEGSLIALLIGPVQFLGQLILLAQNGMAGFERVLEITDASVEIKDKPGAQELDREAVRGEIVFENVSFAYGKGSRTLDGINLMIKTGEIVALLGASGSGKTTFANLLPRFYDVSDGRVLLDGCDVRAVTLKSLRSNIGIVSQDIFLFSATIRENICYGKHDATNEMVFEASKVAKVDEFVERFPDKYETLVGERGITLSGGQKQRIAIARTIITDPRVLILDDSLSSVDVGTEFVIQDALKAVVAGRTTLIITQRLSTLRLAGRIIVFDHGRIAEEGTHESLLSLNGLYSRLYYSQLAPQELEAGSEIFATATRKPES